jgi:hypothetical protein
VCYLIDFDVDDGVLDEKGNVTFVSTSVKNFLPKLPWKALV